MNMAVDYVPYKEPSVVELLILISFFVFLKLAGFLTGLVVGTPILGYIAGGIIYGKDSV